MPDTQAASRPSLHRVLQHSTLYLIGNVASRAVAFLAIPFYSRFLSPAQYGLIELIELSTQTVAIAFGLQAIGTALTRLFHDQTSIEAERNVVSTALIGTAALSACVTIAAVAGAGAIGRAVFHTDEWTTLLQAAFVAMFFGSQIEVVLVYERMRDNARFYLAYSLATLGLSLGLNILFIGVLDFGVWGFVSSKIIVSVGGAGFLLRRLRRDVGWHWRGVYVPEFIRFGAPLIVSGLCYFAIHFSDRFFLTSAVSLAELGRYALAYRFALMVNVLIGDSFAKSWNVSLYRHTDASNWRQDFARVAAYFTFVLSTTGVAIAVFSPELLRVMVPPDFYPPALLLPVLVLAYVVRDVADFFRSLLLINKRSSWVGQIAFGAAVLNLVVNVLLIPAYGIHGAAWATLLTWSGYLAISWVVAHREHRLPIRAAPYGRLLLLMVGIYAAAATFRVPGLALQILLDGMWVALFAVLAVAVFLSPGDRRAAVGQLGGILARLLVPQLPDLGTTDRRIVLLDCRSPLAAGAAGSHGFVEELLRLGTPVDVIGFPALDLKHVSRLARGMEHLLLPYDDRLAWLPHICAAGVRVMAPGTVLLSVHPPVAAHLAALAIRRRTGRPWIADLREPLACNPGRPSYRTRLIDPMIERLVIEHADAIIVDTSTAAAALVARHPTIANKVNILPRNVSVMDQTGIRPRTGRKHWEGSDAMPSGAPRSQLAACWHAWLLQELIDRVCGPASR